MTDVLIDVRDVSKKFCRSFRQSLHYGAIDIWNELTATRKKRDGVLRPGEFWAVRDVSFQVKRGECLGLIGANGAGKTTILRMLNGLVRPDTGSISIRGRVGALIALGAGFNPVLTGRENIYVNAAVLGFKSGEVSARFDEIVAFAEIEEFLDMPVQSYSSGMAIRLGFSIAVHLEPDILLVDEALAVGDIGFTVKCLNRIAELRQGGTAVIFVAHDELQVREAAQTCLLVDHGETVMLGPPDDAFRAYSEILSSRENDRHKNEDEALSKDVRIQRSGRVGAVAGEDVSLHIGCVCEAAEISSPFELRFWNTRGQLVSTIQTNARELRLSAGHNRVDINITRLPLAPGIYRIAAGFRKDGAVLGWSREAMLLEVLPSSKVWNGWGSVLIDAMIASSPTTSQSSAAIN
jgi:ABC-type polysaccharide/polyol phosphate transport system ATPase subunit